MRRVFLAIEIPAPQRRVLALAQAFLPAIRPTDPEGFHLTLVFLGEMPDALLIALDEEMSRLCAQPFTLALTGLGLFGGARPHAVWAGAAPEPALGALHEACTRTARRAGWTGPAQRFHPHVTLGSMGRLETAERVRLEEAVLRGGGFKAAPFPVEEVTLYESRPGGTGRRYLPLACYRLAR
jgi:2'-5' RNA ligase